MDQNTHSTVSRSGSGQQGTRRRLQNSSGRRRWRRRWQVLVAAVALLPALLVVQQPSVAQAASGTTYYDYFTMRVGWSDFVKKPGGLIQETHPFFQATTGTYPSGATGKATTGTTICAAFQVQVRNRDGGTVSDHFETGCVTKSYVIPVPTDLSSGTIPTTTVPLDLLTEVCDNPADPNDCHPVLTPSRSVTVSASLTATGPVDTVLECVPSQQVNHTFAERPASATATFDNQQAVVGTSKDNVDSGGAALRRQTDSRGNC